MELIKLTSEELATIRTYYEGTIALDELMKKSCSNMEREDLEIALDMLLPMIKMTMLMQHDFFNTIKNKYKVKDIFYCSKDGNVYGRL